MRKVGDIKSKKLLEEKELGNSRFEFKISGNDINYVVMNTLRRVIFSDIPIYAFDRFSFEKNWSVFHNTYMKQRISMMPVWNIPNENEIYVPEVLDEKEKTNEIKEETQKEPTEIDEIISTKPLDNVDDIELEFQGKIDSSTLNQMTMYINFKNDTKDYKSATTQHAKFYYSNLDIASPYPNPIQLIKLHEGGYIAFSAITKLGIESMNAKYSAVCICIYRQHSETEFDFVLESRGQLTEQRIIHVATVNIIKQLDDFNNLMSKMIKEKPDNILDKQNVEQDITSDTGGKIIVNNSDDTMGNLLSTGMRLHPNIKWCGYSMPHPLSKKVFIEYELKKISPNIAQVVDNVVEYYKDLFGKINSNVQKL